MKTDNWSPQGPDTNLKGKAREEFFRLYQRHLKGGGKIPAWETIQSPPGNRLQDYDALPESTENSKNFSRLAVCKLNGGLGTTMGCSQTKSLLMVREEKSFLDLILDQLGAINGNHSSDVPLLLMNSFYTDLETRNFLKGYEGKVRWQTLLQNKFPRLHADTGKPLEENEYGNEACYPPGHGDLLYCLHQQGILDALLEEGRDILFVSNADNLGALPDIKILDHIVENKIPFLMEMTPKTKADVKGGTLYVDGEKLKLLEIGSVPEEYLQEFCSQEKFKTFNTNNIWLNLSAVKESLEKGGLDLEVIGNKKKVGKTPVVQLETALGSAINCIDGSCGIVVSRDRFIPVKKTSDLLLLRSNLFVFNDGAPLKNPLRKLKELPEIHLGPEFDNLDDFQSRIPDALDCIELRSLHIEGDVRFEGDCILKGDVKISASEGNIKISKGSLLQSEPTV